MKYKSFQDMEVWKEALKLSTEIFMPSGKLPKCEDYGLTSQLRRSANSVNANIAEAFGRSTGPDKSRIYVFAKGSAYETQSHLIYGTSVGYFDHSTINALVDKYEHLITSLNKIIKHY
jgi:four helix bundle protein